MNEYSNCTVKVCAKQRRIRDLDLGVELFNGSSLVSLYVHKYMKRKVKFKVRLCPGLCFSFKKEQRLDSILLWSLNERH